MSAKPIINDDPQFRAACEKLEAVPASGFFVAFFQNVKSDGTCDFHFHQHASEAMMELLLREIFADPRYTRAVTSALNNHQNDISDTMGSA